MLNRTSLTYLTTAALLAANLGSSSAATPVRTPGHGLGSLVVVPQGLVVRVVIESELSSAKSLVGDTFAVHASQDVAVGNYIVVKAGAPGRGEILAESAANGTVAGQLSYTLDYVTGVDGKMIRLTGSDNTHNTAAINGSVDDANRTATLTSTATDVASRMGAVSAVTGALGPLGGVASMAGSLFRHAKARNAVIAPNTTVPSYVVSTVHTFSNIKVNPGSDAADDGYAK